MNYAKTAAKVKAQLAKAGMSMTLSRVVPGVYDLETATAASTTTTFNGSGLKLNYSLHMIDGTRILAGDQRVYLDPLIGAEPQPGDTLTIGAEVWSVVASRPLSPAGIVVLHDVQCRKS